MTLSPRITLVLPFKKVGFSKVSSIRDRRCFYALLILIFYYFAKELMGIPGTRQQSSADNPVP